jgi:nicotinamidase-related amidase
MTYWAAETSAAAERWPDPGLVREGLLLFEELSRNTPWVDSGLDYSRKAAKEKGYEVFISPHYFFPTDRGWKFNGPLEADEAANQLFARSGRLSLDGFTGSGADWLERFKPYINDGKTVVVSPHRVFGPQTNDLVLQLRKRRISKVILGGMLANMCVESHLRELLEQGFEVTVVKDATAAPRHPEWGYGYTAALINFAFLAHGVLSTDETLKAMS